MIDVDQDIGEKDHQENAVDNTLIVNDIELLLNHILLLLLGKFYPLLEFRVTFA